MLCISAAGVGYTPDGVFVFAQYRNSVANIKKKVFFWEATLFAVKIKIFYQTKMYFHNWSFQSARKKERKRKLKENNYFTT